MILSGIYTRENEGFNLKIDDPFTDSFWDESLRLEISAVHHSDRIEQVEFINIDDWDMALIEKLEDFFDFNGFW